MSVKTALEAKAAELQSAMTSLGDSLGNIANDISNLSNQLAEAGTESDVIAILQPQLDALKALADAAANLAAVTPDVQAPPPVEPPL